MSQNEVIADTPDGLESDVDQTILENAVARSVEAILRYQSDSGAFIASPDFNQYHFCWLRDGSFISYALDCVGEHEASARYHQWVNDAVMNISGVIDDVIDRHRRGEQVSPLQMPPARFAIDGTTVVDDWPNFQIDGYGTWLWSLAHHLARIGKHEVPDEYRESVARVSRYLDVFSLSPCYDVWEESGTAQHTSTLACVYGGLTAAAVLLDDKGLLQSAEIVRARIEESAAVHGMYVKSTENSDVDASALWLAVPFHVVDFGDARFTKTVAAIEQRLTLDGGIRRYVADVYFGSGAWPVLTASLGWFKCAIGDLDGARQCRDWIVAHFDGVGRLAEQFGGERRDPGNYRLWVQRWGAPAQDLTWSHAMFVILHTAIEKFE